MLLPNCRWSGLAVVRDLVQVAEAYTRSLYSDVEPVTAIVERVLTPDGGQAHGADGRKLAADGPLGLIDIDALYIADFTPPTPTELDAWLANMSEVIKKLRQVSSAIPVAAVGSGVFLALEAGLGLSGPVAAPPHLASLVRHKRRRQAIDPTQTVVVAPDLLSTSGLGGEPELALALLDRCVSSNLTSVLASRTAIPDRTAKGPELDGFAVPLLKPDDLVAKACLSLRTQFSHPIELRQLASELGVTARTLNRRFQASLGMGPKAYLQHLRVAAARSQLERTTRPVARISALVGYADTAFFIRMFRSRLGVTPAQYRQQVRSGSHA